MAKFKLTNKTVADLNGIWEYTTDKWSKKQADKYYRELMESFKWIANNPILGKNYGGIAPSLFGFKENRHIIFFRTLEKDLIEITRILHERIDLKNRLEE